MYSKREIWSGALLKIVQLSYDGPVMERLVEWFALSVELWFLAKVSSYISIVHSQVFEY
jgi:hypothetical protein